MGVGWGPWQPPLTTLPHSDSGTFLGLGTVTGSVAIHIAFSLQVSWGRGVGQPRWLLNSPSPLLSPQRLYYVKEAHGIVVTDVAFVPESRPGRELLGGHEAALLSVAVDSRCKLHLLPTRRTSGGLPVGLRCLCSSSGMGGAAASSHPCLSHRFPPCLAAAAALCWADCGHHLAAAAHLPRLPVAPWPPEGPPGARSDPPASTYPTQTVKDEIGRAHV